MMYDVGIRFNAKSAAFYRVHSSGLSAFVMKVQRKGDFIFSVIGLYPKKEDTRQERPRIYNEHYRHREHPSGLPVDEVDTEAVDDFEVHRNGHVVDPIDHRIMVDSHGY